MGKKNIIAVDLGASSGRVMLAKWDSRSQEIILREVSRFSNNRHVISGKDCWDIDHIEQHIFLALAKMDSEGIMLNSIGIDSWGVDTVLLDSQKKRIGETVSYRDNRTQGIMEKAKEELGEYDIYSRTGIQFLPFNTIYQMRALYQQEPKLHKRVAYMLMIPDYLNFRLTGKMSWEHTNATTTQLLKVGSYGWDSDLLSWAKIDPSWVDKPTPPGSVIGYWSSGLGNQVPVVATATHDTASAVAAVPLKPDSSAIYLSSGTWSLMGFESKDPYISMQTLGANLTNEGGISSYRVLKNIMGLWLLQSVCNELKVKNLDHLLWKAKREQSCKHLINPNDPRFINPTSMVEEIRHACSEHTDMPIPNSAASLARCILDSLAFLYRTTISELASIRHRDCSQVNIVGGGSQNGLLNQMCANSCQVNVLAGPIEASTLGNIGYQLIALGDLTGLASFRDCIESNFPLKKFEPADTESFNINESLFKELTQ
jgi:rhamnulokinase